MQTNSLKMLAKQHGIELFYCVLYSLVFVSYSMRELEEDCVGAPLLFAPMFLMIIYSLHAWQWAYKFSVALPVLGSVTICKLNLRIDELLIEPKFWAAYLLVAIVFFARPFWRDDIKLSHVLAVRFGAFLDAVAMSFIMFLLAVSVVASVENLFDLDFRNDYGANIFCICAFAVFVPRFLIRVREQHVPSWEELIFYIFGGFLALYALLLHVYAVYIASLYELPRGVVSSIVLPYLYGGFALWLIAPAFAKFERYLRYFAPLCVVPLGLLGVAIWQRVSEYGITIERYCLIAVGVAAGLFTLLMLVRARRNLAIFGLVVVVVVAAFVLDARRFAFNSQIKFFEAKLAKLNFLDANGQIKFDANKEWAQGYQALEIANDAEYIAKNLSDENLTLRYGENFDKLVAISDRNNIYEQHQSYYFMLSSLDELEILGDRRAIFLGSLFELGDNYYVEDENNKTIFIFNVREKMEQIFAKNGLKFNQEYNRETLEKIGNDFLVFHDKNSTVVFSGARVYYDLRNKEYKFDTGENGWLFIKK